MLEAAAWLPLRIKIGGASGPRSYRIVVQATDPDSSIASTNIGSNALVHRSYNAAVATTRPPRDRELRSTISGVENEPLYVFA